MLRCVIRHYNGPTELFEECNSKIETKNTDRLLSDTVLGRYRKSCLAQCSAFRYTNDAHRRREVRSEKSGKHESMAEVFKASQGHIMSPKVNRRQMVKKS